MTSSPRLFRTRTIEIENNSFERPVPPARPFGSGVAQKAEPSDYTIATERGTLHSISPRSMIHLRSMGLSEERIGEVLHTVDVLGRFSNRPIEPSVFECVKQRYGLGMGTMASIASMSTLRAADIGITVRGLARFYSRYRREVGDVDELERFMNWAIARGQNVKGVPSAWSLYNTLMSAARTGRAKSRPRARNYSRASRRRR